MSGQMILAVLVFYPFLGALLARIIGQKNNNGRDYFADFVVISEFLLMAYAWTAYGIVAEGGEAECSIAEICGFGLNFTMGGFRLVYCTVAAFMWMMTVIMSREYMMHHSNRNRYYFYMLLTLGATMGVFLSADLYTTYIFFEIMSFTSYVWVAQEETKGALRAADTYLAVAVIGGMTLLMGLFMLYNLLGTLRIDQLVVLGAACENRSALYAAGICVVFGFGAKAGAFPIHIWLPKSHPVAPAPASALLSGILTKAGVLGILIISCRLFLGDRHWGIFILTIGVLTMFGGAMLAVFSIDLKRTLACSSMSQIGFILVGVGSYDIMQEENFLAAHGAMLHMINHSLIKLVLFMAAGVVYMNLHALDLDTIRGYGRKKPFLMACFLAGALAIGGIPLFGGYISKTLLHEGLLVMELGIWTKVVEYIFLFSGGLTVAYMTKLFAAIFIEENNDHKLQKKYDAQKKYMNAQSCFALGGSALVLLIWGLFPHVFMDQAAKLGELFLDVEESGSRISYFSLENLKGALISIIIGALVYLFFIRKVLVKKTADGKISYIDRWPKWFDLEDVIYRPLLLKILPTILGIIFRIFDSFTDTIVVVLRKTIYRDSPLPKPKKAPTDRRFLVHEDIEIIRGSFSYGFTLFGLGVMVTLVYILFF